MQKQSQEHGTTQPLPFERILFCTDFSENADAAFALAIKLLATMPSAHFHILHISPEPGAQFWKTYVKDALGPEDDPTHPIEEKIKESYLSQIPQDVHAVSSIRSGAADREILAYAGEINADLIILGRQGRSAINGIFFGNIAEKIARRASCSVLVVPPAAPHHDAENKHNPKQGT